MQNCPAAEQKKLLWSLQMVLLSNFSSNDLQQLTQLYLPGKKKINFIINYIYLQQKESKVKMLTLFCFGNGGGVLISRSRTLDTAG
jgi:hypothetical protein